MSLAPVTIVNQGDLLAEADALSRFIVSEVAPREFAERYVAAHEHLFRESADAGDLELIALALRRRWLLPSIDAALALRRPDALLHKKALLMAAILEASPRYAEAFLPRRRGPIALAWLSMRVGFANAIHLAIGLPIVWWHGRGAKSGASDR